MEWVGGVPLRLWLMERLNFENRVLPGLGIIGLPAGHLRSHP